MSTPTDRHELQTSLMKWDRDSRVLYVGVHEGVPNIVRSRFYRIDTLDNNKDLHPFILVDLNDPTARIDYQYDLIICSYVLMHLHRPLAGLETLLRSRGEGGTLLVQENVVRDRPDADPWPDRNRFVSRDVRRGDAMLALDEAHKSGRRVIDLGPADSVTQYLNEGGISAIWEFTREK